MIGAAIAPGDEAPLKQIGKYEILGELGAGAMGSVYRARDPVLDRFVALKTVSAALVTRPESLQRFQREARAAARLQHPNIVTIYELGEVEGLPYIAMELLEGHDLARVVAERERFSLGHRLRMTADICRALDYAHKRGVIHRDVKPANVRLLPDGSVRLVDFGIARLADAKMTQTGLVLGTPSYLAPEVLTEGRVDHRADMWAVGVMLYEMLAGHCPFRAETIPALIFKIVRDPLPPLDAAGLGLPPAVVEVVERALRKQPAERYADLAEMALALEVAGGLSGPLPPVLSPEERARAGAHSFDEARRLLQRNDLERALEAARRAQALDPSRSDVLGLLKAIEERLEDAPTLPMSAPPERTTGVPYVTLGASVELPPPRPADALETLRRLGASAYRDAGVFGDPAPSQGGCLAPDGSRLVTAGADGIRLWDLTARTRAGVLRTDLHRRTGHDAAALALAFSPDSRLLASGHVDGGVHLWELATGAEVPVKLRHDAMVGAVAFSPDGRTLATGGLDSAVKLWDVAAARSGDARRELLRQPAAVTALAWTPDGARLVTGHQSRLLRVLDARSHRLTATLRGPEAPVNALLLLPDGERLVVASQDRTLRVFHLGGAHEERRLTLPRRAATAMALVGGQVLATASLDNTVRLYELATGAELAVLWSPAEEAASAVVALEGGRRLAVALADGRVRLWEAVA